MSLTMREVEWRLEKISRRTNSERSFQANLHGVKLKKSKEDKTGPTKISREQFFAAKEAMERLKNGKRCKT